LIINLIQASTLVLRPSKEMLNAFQMEIFLELGMEQSISGCPSKRFGRPLRLYPMAVRL
jgi:hypothetical protein